MKTLCFPFAVVAAAILLGCAGCGRRVETKMSTELEMKHLIDLGTILDTTIPLQLSIPVKNRGERTVTITRLSKDCSCTSVSIDKTILQPGETANVHVVTNLSGKTVLFVSEIVVESDSSEKIDEIQIQGQITGQVRIRPLRTALLMGEKDQPGSFTVFCDNQDGKWTYEGSKSDDPNLKIDLRLTAESATTSTYAGTVSLPASVRVGYPDYGTTCVRLEFTHGRLNRKLELSLPVDLVVRRKLTVDPPEVTFNHAATDQQRAVLVQSADALDIDSATCKDPRVRPNLRWVDKKNLLVELAFDSSQTGMAVPKELSCDLLSGRRTVARIPINFVASP